MKTFSVLSGALAAALCATQAIAADCEIDQRTKVETAFKAAPSQAELATYLAPLMSKPRYFETNCGVPQLDHPLYPGVPVKACTYERAGLKGWVMLANPSPQLAASWISNACADQKDARACAARLTAHAWCTSQLAFPVVGNLIQAPRAAGQPPKPTNLVYLHGVAIDRPAWMPEDGPVDIETQKARLAPLAVRERTYTGSTAQVSWPSGLQRDAYVKYGLATAKLQVGDVGRSCPASARRPEWIDVSRILFNRGWRDGRNPMFEAAAKALMADDKAGEVACG